VALIEKKIKEEAALDQPQDQLVATPLPATSLSGPGDTLSPMPSYSMSDPRAVDIVRHPEFG